MLNTTIKLSTKLDVVVFPQYAAFHNVHISLRNKKNKLNRLYAFRPALLCTFLFIVFSVSRLCAQPDLPSNLYVISQDKSNELYWIPSSSAGVTEYRIYRSEDSVSFTNIGTMPAPDTTYTDNGLINGTFYFYRVTAFDGNESLPSNTDASTPQALLGRYLEFDGVDDYLVVDDSSDYMLQQNLSLEFWFRAEDTINIQHLLDRVSHASNTHPYNILLKDGKLTYRRAGDNTYYDISTINKDTWYHLAITRDAASAGTINFYLNGFLKLTITGTFSYSESYYSPCVLSIGSQSSSSGGSINYSAFFDGQIAELRIWDKTLTPTEITNNMNIRLKGDETDLLALFHLDDIYNTTVYNYTSVLRNAVAVGGPVSYNPRIKANNENLSIQEDETNHYFNIKANDSYGARTKIKTEIIEAPNHGTAKVVNKDSILFTPLLNYNGYDTIRYVLVDTTVFGVDPYIYSDTAFLYITVTPVNDPPIITSNGGGTTAYISIVENSDSITTVTATDIDIPAQTISYSITVGTDQGLFVINNLTGKLSFKNVPDYENPADSNSDNIYNIQVTATDNGTGSLTDVQNIEVSVTNVNDPPDITSNGGGANATVNVKENITPVVVVTATDDDIPAQNLQFFISNGSDSSKFNIEANTGVLTFKIIPDFETPSDNDANNIYNVTVSVTDGLDTTSQDIAVTIMDVDESGFFITKWQTTTADEQITIPTNGNGYNYTVNWGDGTEATSVAGDTAHIYPIPGIYTVSITGDFPSIYFYNQGDNAKRILTVEQWGNIAWQSMGNAFIGCTNLRVPATDAPDLSNVEHLSSMFRGCTFFNDSIEHWDVSNIKNMSSMFKGDSSFNQPLNNWDVSGVTNMESMFENTSSFDQPLDNWDVSSVKNMYGMFRKTDFFNQDIGGWDVSNVTTMYTMFREAASFNQDISGWDMSNVTDISNMFYKASAFDQNLGKWQLNKDVKIPYNTFKGCGISCDNYSAALQEWASNPTISDSVKLSAADLIYGSHAIISRNKLISEKGWTISNDFLGKGTNDCTPANRPFVTVWDSDSTGISANNQITIPTNGTGYKYYVHWEDVADNNSNGMLGPVYGDTTVTFPAEGKYRVTIVGDFPRIFFNNGGDTQKLQKVEQWGDNTWTNMEAAFLGCSNLTVTASDIPDLSNITSMSQMFKGATTLNDFGNPNWDISNVQDMSELFFDASNFNGNIGNWDVRNVQNMAGMFQGALSFNQPIGGWDVSNVQYMDSMFSGTWTFDQSIINWDVSNVQNMEYMFHKAQSFNQSINDWNLNSIGSQGINYMFSGANSFNQPLDKWTTIIGTRITQLNSVFNGAVSFNQPIESWDVSNVTSMDSLFAGAQAFNQPLNGWDVSNVSSMNAMFRGAGLFNQYLGSWKLNSTQRAEMLDGTGIDCINFSATLNRWQNNTTVTNVILGAQGLEYGTNAADAVNELVNNRSWTINGSTASLSQCILFEIDDIVDTMVNENDVYTSVTPSITGTPIGNIIYSISGGADAADFSINTTTGLVSMEDRDYEFPADENFDNIYEIEITITDDDGNTASENWKVTIADENESPTDISLSLTSVNENETAGTIVGYFISTDEDSGDAHSYSLVTGTGDTDNSSFQISGNELLTSEIFDYESKNLYSIRIRTTDNGTGSLTYEKELTIEVININDAPSGITLDNDHIDEGLPGNTYVGLFNTIDDDHSDNHTYDLVPGEGDADNSRFMIAGTVLRTSEILKYNNQSTYFIRVRTTDNGDGNLTCERAFTISLNKINNPPTGISITQSNINENKPEDTEIGILTSIDLDAEDSYTYQILDGYDKDYFEITGNTLIASESFNFEIRDNYSIAIRTTDSGGKSFDSTFVIVVNDINDPPFFVNDDNISISFEEYSLEAYDSLSLCPKIFDEDGDVTSYISMQVVNNNGTLNEDPSNTGCLIFVPDTSYRGIEEAVLVVSDNNTPALTDTLVFQFTITEPYINYSPVITDEFNSTVDTLYYVTFVNEAINICLNAYDLNGDVISVSGINIYEGAAETEMPGYSELCFDVWPATDFIGEVYASIILQDNGSPVLSDTVIMSLLVEPKLEFSQAISPNGDGIADYLHISGIEKFPDNNLTIFNRWGDIVYHQESYNNNDNIWNGQADGRAQGYIPDGTYFYLLEIEGLKKQIKGYLVLKRKSHE